MLSSPSPLDLLASTAKTCEPAHRAPGRPRHIDRADLAARGLGHAIKISAKSKRLKTAEPPKATPKAEPLKAKFSKPGYKRGPYKRTEEAVFVAAFNAAPAAAVAVAVPALHL
jgi:hypothetical protein